MNGCKNLRVEGRLGDAHGTAELFVVGGSETGCNSLRPPDVVQHTERMPVTVETLDRVLKDFKIENGSSGFYQDGR